LYYLVRLCHEGQDVVGQLDARAVDEAAARGLDCYGSEGHRIPARDTECFRHHKSDLNIAGIGVRPEDSAHKASQDAVQADDLVTREDKVALRALVLKAPFSNRASRDWARRLRQKRYLGPVSFKRELIGAKVVIAHRSDPFIAGGVTARLGCTAQASPVQSQTMVIS
jgi:hypothetical protein